jgi:ABC-type transport system involved in multi-copper enzyme maturation permease subunit
VNETVTAKPNEPAATIYDLGYKRYLGTRRSQATRWLVIARHQVAYAWTKWWRLKLYVVIAAITTAIFGALLVFAHSDAMGSLKSNGQFIKRVDEILFASNVVLPMIAFFLALTVGCRVIAADLRTGAFNFYFVRPVRPIDYIAGKLAGLSVVIAAVVLAPMLVIAGIRVGVSDGTTELLDNLAYLPKALLIGTLTSVAYASLALGFSALFSKAWLNRIMWAAYFFIFMGVIRGIAFAAGIDEVMCIDPGMSVQALAYGVYGVDPPKDSHIPGGIAGLVGLLVNTLVPALIAYRQVNVAATRGIGQG